ncbi:MAG: hypothetical protein JW874_11265 [Spirochaetales bacterium]|nr:hypothetical protein [Spirochaetales bacterium]
MKKAVPVLLVILYLVLFHIPVQSEFVPVLLFSTSVPEQKTAAPGMSPMLDFSGMNNGGYIDENGSVIFSFSGDSPVQIAAGYCLVMKNKGHYSLLNINGGNIADFHFNGTADFRDEALFVRSYDFRGLSIYTKGGKLIWERQFGNPVTAYMASNGITAVGLSDGSLILLNSGGEIIYKRKFDYADLSCIYALALSKKADKVAVIYGNYPQFLHVISSKEGQGSEYRDLLVEALESDFRENVFLFFSDDEKTIAFKTNNGLGYYSFRKQQKGEIPVRGEVLSAVLSGNGNFVYFVTTGEGHQRMNYADLNSGYVRQGGMAYDFLSLSMIANRLLLYTGSRNRIDGEEGLAGPNRKTLYLYGLERR